MASSPATVKKLNSEVETFKVETFRSARLYPTIIRTCVLFFSILVILTDFWALRFPRNEKSVDCTLLFWP